MYIRDVHAERDIPTLQTFVTDNPLGLFTTAIPNPKYATLQTTHIAFILDPNPDSEQPGKLRAHMARANPQAKALIEAQSAGSLDEVLVLFNGPAHHYVTPRFYKSTKPATGKVVPTWDYQAVQVYGKLRVYSDVNKESADFLLKQMNDLNQWGEKQIPSEDGHVWKVDDAPDRYIQLLLKGVIGLEIEITRMEGRFKLNQESGDGDWKGVVDGFQSMKTPTGDEMARMVEESGKNRAVA